MPTVEKRNLLCEPVQSAGRSNLDPAFVAPGGMRVLARGGLACGLFSYLGRGLDSGRAAFHPGTLSFTVAPKTMVGIQILLIHPVKGRLGKAVPAASATGSASATTIYDGHRVFLLGRTRSACYRPLLEHALHAVGFVSRQRFAEGGCCC